MISTQTGTMLRIWLLFLFCASVLAEFNVGLDRHWKLWKKVYHKKYHNEVEEMSRRALWEKNLMQINLHNLEANLGLHSHNLGINHLSDLTKEEMVRIYANLRLPENSECEDPPHFEFRKGDLPSTVDWRDKNLVTSVKDQGSCGSCWAFSTAGALEGMWAKTKGELVDLSPQNLVDCAGGKYGNEGCGGGWMHKALQYVMDNGIASWKDYPYTGEDDVCKNVSRVAATCSSYHCVKENEASLKKASANVGPIAVAINAFDIFQYKSGVFNEDGCDKMLNHGVLLVGYGTDETTKLDYWLIKNSWGEQWGENGYLRLARNKDQMCGISTYSVFPIA